MILGLRKKTIKLHFFTLNLEYRISTTDDFEDGITVVKISSRSENSSEYVVKETIFSVSASINL